MFPLLTRMTMPWGLTPPWGLIGVLALVSAGIAGIVWYGAQREQEGYDRAMAKWAQAQIAQQAEALKQAEANAQETQRRLDAQRKAQEAHDAEIAQARRDADAAAAAADRLRGQLARYTAAHRGATSNPPAVGVSPPAQSALDLLADLFSRVDARAGELAQFADAAHAAGKQCERESDTLNPKEK